MMMMMLVLYTEAVTDLTHVHAARPQVAHHAASIVYAKPTPGVLEIEPSMAWNPAVLAGAG